MAVGLDVVSPTESFGILFAWDYYCIIIEVACTGNVEFVSGTNTVWPDVLSAFDRFCGVAVVMGASTVSAGMLPPHTVLGGYRGVTCAGFLVLPTEYVGSR